MQILVFNCGSSSLNYKVYDADQQEMPVLISGKAHRVGVISSEPAFIEHHSGTSYQKDIQPIPNHPYAARLVLSAIQEQDIKIDVIGHRFVHGGSIFCASTWLTPEVEPKIRACLPLASLHNPNSWSVIETCREILPNCRQYLTFDTAFHASLPPEAYTYALPAQVIRESGTRKYGFHGLSYQYVTDQVARTLNRDLSDLNMVACHLGTGGSSAAAIRNGKSVDTSMGFTPLAGLMMSTRTGDMDALLVLRLLEDSSFTPGELDTLLNKKSGLLGVSGFSSDIRDIQAAILEKADPKAKLAYAMYIRRLRETIARYVLLLGRVDALIFTDDIGARNAAVRQAACQDLEWCGVCLDLEKNSLAEGDRLNRIDRAGSPVAIFCLPTDEEGVIALEGKRLMEETKA